MILHGHWVNGKPTHEWICWRAMRSRCENERCAAFSRYGGAGITVDARWKEFAQFLADVGPAPSPKHSLDRIDNKRGYTPDNVRWATPKEQMQNRRMSQTHCKRGHERTANNVYVTPRGLWDCRVCREIRMKAYRQKLRGVTA